MARNEFETEAGDLLKEYYPVIHRIADAAFNRKLGRQVSKKPFDYFGTDSDGRGIAAEAKRVKVNRFAFNKLSDHQYNALDAWNKVGGNAMFLLNFRVREPGKRCGRAFWIPFNEYKVLKKSITAEGRKSIRPDDIPEWCELERVKGGWKIQEGAPSSILV